MTLFRGGSEEAFRVIHDRYRARMLAYARQMLSGSIQDPEDAVQEVFVRAYAGLRASDRELALRAWLYRIAHNRCVDDLRRPRNLVLDEAEAITAAAQDPLAKVVQRDALRRLIVDVQRLPEQQRSALLMRELAGMPYADVAGALSVSVPAVKSLLVRARVGLAQANEARDTACTQIREDLILAHDRGVRTSGLARRHMRDCRSCREFRGEVRGVSRQFAALTPAFGPIAVLAHLLGFGSSAGGGAAAGGASAGGAAAGGALAGGGALGTGTAAVAGTGAASAGLVGSGASHVVTLLAAAVVTAGGAVEIQSSLSAPPPHRVHHQRRVTDLESTPARPGVGSARAATGPTSAADPALSGVAAAAGSPAPSPAQASAPRFTTPTVPVPAPSSASRSAPVSSSARARPLAITQYLDPDLLMNQTGTSSNGSGTPPASPGATAPGPGNPGPGAPVVPAPGNPVSSPGATSGAPGPGASPPSDGTTGPTLGAGGPGPGASGGTSPGPGTGTADGSSGTGTGGITPATGGAAGSRATSTATGAGAAGPGTPAGGSGSDGSGVARTVSVTARRSPMKIHMFVAIAKRHR